MNQQRYNKDRKSKIFSTRWCATGSAINEFSSLFNTSGRSLTFISEHLDHTCKARFRKIFHPIKDFNRNEQMN